MKRHVTVVALALVGMLALASFSAQAGEKTIIIISKSLQNQFYQAAFVGANAAGKDFGVSVVVNGPDAESNIPQQVEQVQAAINQRPAALVLAACDPTSVQEALARAKENKIPVIGFDSGVPGDTSGAVIGTAATNNVNAGGVVADNLADSPAFQAKVKAATAANPAVIAVLAQDSTSGSIVQRTDGFVYALKKRVEALDSSLVGAVSIGGQDNWSVPSSKPATVKIVVTVPPTTNQADIQSVANAMLLVPNTVAIFAANQDAVNGLISSTADGTELNRQTGRYKDILVVGFDAGSNQKDAVRSGAFFGSVTQDPYQMGYASIKMAAEAADGKPVSDIDTGAKWYNSKNIDNPDIALLLYD
ncbi:MAG: substrate-binding domain-containing protein [Planctomycetota bacterium]|nr:substrate-binding domain-containing protein [Planctomycetota bacterium]